jgi:hypothetical protein
MYKSGLQASFLLKLIVENKEKQVILVITHVDKSFIIFLCQVSF